MTLTCSHCGGRDVELVDSNGATDGTTVRIEFFECHHCGESFSNTLTP